MHRSALILSTLSMLFAIVASADEANETVRTEFQRAYMAVAAGDSTANNDSETLRSYILYPYLQQVRLRHALTDLQADPVVIDAAVEAFLQVHDGEAVNLELRRAWYLNLAQRIEWERLLANYRDVGDPNLQCYAMTARLELKRFENLEADAVRAWSTSPDSRTACEPVFAWLKSQPSFNDALVEKRARLALTQGNRSFARQMIALLPQETAEPLTNWVALIRSPPASIDGAIANPDRRIETQALLDGWTRLARADQGAAMQHYKPLIAARKLPPETASRMALELALALSWNRKSEAVDYFTKVRPEDMDERAYEWSARAALYAANWRRAAAVLSAMPPSLAKQTKWRYWTARVAELRGNRSSARAQYTTLLGDDNYYASLAAARLGKPYTPKPKRLAVNEEQVQKIADLPAFMRARELIAMDSPELRGFAYDEWRRGYNSLDNAARLQSIALASRWGWHDQTVLTAAQQSFFDDYVILYPRPFDADVQSAADIVKLPDTLIYATLRQESLYRSDAQSTAGASGLMQLIGDTGRRTLRRWPDMTNVVKEPRNLLNPTTSIHLGSAKLRELMDHYEDKTALALAAYNAGPGAVDRWLPKKPIDIDIWIENVPYNETRIYVQRILWHSVVFGWLKTKQAQSTTSWLVTTQLKPPEKSASAR